MAKRAASSIRSSSYFRRRHSCERRVLHGTTGVLRKIEELRRRKSALEATIRYLEQYGSLPGTDTDGHDGSVWW